MRKRRLVAALVASGIILALGVAGLAWTVAAGSSEAQQGTMHDCPNPGKWSIAVWEGDDNSDVDQALATCTEEVAAAYALDPDTGQWSRWFAGKPDVSNLSSVDNMEGVLALGGTATAAAADALTAAQAEGEMHNCPQAGRWSIAVWAGESGTAAADALAACGDDAVAAAYSLDAATGAWSRWFAGKPDVSNLSAVDNMEGVLALGAAAATTPGTPSLPAGWTKIEPGGDTICATGTPYAFYVHPGTVNRLVVYFQGAGLCYDDSTCSNPSLYNGSLDETDNPANHSQGMADLDNPENPFKDWYQVFLPDCTGDVHRGNATTTYHWGGVDHTINHKGFVNVSAVLDWIQAEFERPEKLFVSGCSSGAAGSVMGAAYVRNLYPDVPLYQLGDSSVGVLTEDFSQKTGQNWGWVQNVPDWIPALQVPVTELTHIKLYTELANYYASDRWAQYNTAHDGTQMFFYAVIGGTGDWGQLMLASIDEIQDATANFEAYTAPGMRHCITDDDTFYTREVNGVKFVDWLEAMVNDQAWDSVTCTDCETDPEAGKPDR